MPNPLDYPLPLGLVSLCAFWLSAWVGGRFRAWRRPGTEGSQEDFSFILGGALTLLGLIVGFTFSMAVGRYDQRKNHEEAEANAIGTEYLRADLLPPAAAAKVRGLLRSYLDQRVLHYESRDARRLRQIGAETTRLQGEMWSVVAEHASSQPTPVTALVVWGMNDVLNAQGYAQAASWNRIPTGAWVLLIAIAIFCNGLVGYVAREGRPSYYLVLPIALATTLLLIADIDSPRGGVIRVHPQNLEATAASLAPP
ncbi:MAG TPA: hypothetical protein VFF02_08640 [Anaeromyxobacteraceae bacterium]|nr:hypothetical protein [Anaeromyxobacteraceae bacterium]